MGNSELRDLFLFTTNEIKDLYKQRDYLEIETGIRLVELENMYNNLATKSSIESQYISFNSFLQEEVGRSYSQVVRSMRIARYLKKYNIEPIKACDIPVTLLEVVAKADVEWTDDLYEELLVSTYSIVLENYGKQPTQRQKETD